MIRECQAAVDWLLETYFGPETSERVAVRVERALTPLAAMKRGRRGAQLGRLHDGDAGDFRRADGSIDASAADLSYFNGLAF